MGSVPILRRMIMYLSFHNRIASSLEDISDAK